MHVLVRIIYYKTLKRRYKMEYELEEVERDYIEFRKEIGEE